MGSGKLTQVKLRQIMEKWNGDGSRLLCVNLTETLFEFAIMH